MGTPDTTDTVNIAAESLLTASELAGLDGIGGKNGAHPSKLFGADWEKEDAPPHVKSYGVVGDALYGQPLDSWARWGVYDERQRKPEFRDFSAITKGLSLDERVRFAIILVQYLKDISMVSQQKTDMFELETLAHAGSWVSTLLRTVDPETRLEVSKIDNPTIQRYFPAPVVEQPKAVETVAHAQSSAVPATEVVAPVQGGMREKFRGLLQGTILEKLFS